MTRREHHHHRLALAGLRLKVGTLPSANMTWLCSIQHPYIRQDSILSVYSVLLTGIGIFLQLNPSWVGRQN